MYQIRTILHPTDFSEQAQAAFRLACSLARHHKAELIVLHVSPVPIVWGEIGASMPVGDDEEIMREGLLPLKAKAPDIQMELRVEQGAPEDLIVTVAGEVGCQLIVMGTHGRSGLGRLMMGSVAEQVLRSAPCPVLTVRASCVEESGKEKEGAAGRVETTAPVAGR